MRGGAEGFSGYKQVDSWAAQGSGMADSHKQTTTTIEQADISRSTTGQDSKWPTAPGRWHEATPFAA